MTGRDDTDQPAQAPEVPDAHVTPTLSVVEAGRFLGLGRSTSYELARMGTFPVPVIRAGRLLRVPTAAVRRRLELDDHV